MAYKVAASAGNWSTAATWESVTNTPTLHASTNVTIDGTARYTATFTAPNTTNAVTGLLLYINARGIAGTLTATLQESGTDTAAAVSIAVTALTAGAWHYLRLPSTYTFATTSAGAYRWKLTISGGSGTTNAGADSGGSLYAYLSTDSRNGVPASTDDTLIGAAVVVDGTQACGNNTTTATAAVRQLGHAVHVCAGGSLAWDTATSVTLTAAGHLVLSPGGTWRMEPASASVAARLRLSMAATGQAGVLLTYNATISLVGASKASAWRSTYASGAGTAADPFITAGDVGEVGDEIVIGAASNSATNYNENETRFIKTKNSPTSYVLSSTSGGAETALTYTHSAGAHIVNLSRNVWIDSTNTARYFYARTNNNTTATLVPSLEWCRLETCSMTIQYGPRLLSATLNGIVLYRVNNIGEFPAGGLYGYQYAGLAISNAVVYNSSVVGLTLETCNSATLTDVFALTTASAGVHLQTSTRVALTRVYINGANTSDVAGGFTAQTGTIGAILDNCQINAARTQSTYLRNMVDGLWRSCQFANLAANMLHIGPVAANYNTVLFENCVFGTGTLISGYTSMLPESEIRLQRYNATDNDHRWYTPYGVGYSEAVTVRTAGSLAVKLAPESTSPGFSWEFNILAKAGAIVSFVGFLRRNTALGTDVATVELFLPGSTVADASYTLPATSDTWLPVAISALYSGTVDLLATVRITVKSVASGAALYADDFYNAGTTNKIAGLDTWDKGKPVSFLVDTTFDPASVWAFSTAQLTTAGTTGKQLNDALTVAKFLGLK